jgi:LPXTG-motif cell wall-anchored protein
VARALLISLTAAAVIALTPVAALAQDVGGQQYTDPLAKQPSTHSQSSPPSTQPSVQPVAKATTTSKSQPTSAPGLPRTGIDVGWLVLTGGVLLAGGLALRRVAERPGA